MRPQPPETILPAPKAAVLVAAELRRQIVTGQLKPGDKLHSESVLQAEFAISRPTLREALRLLESESLINISRGKHGGARVSSVDLGAVATQVGVFLQIGGTTLDDIWQARTIIEPPAAGLLAARRDMVALGELEANIEDERTNLRQDVRRYADLSAEFSIIITRHCGNQTLHLLASLMFDIIRRQHLHIAERTLQDSHVDRLRQDSIQARTMAVGLMRSSTPAAVESFWRGHLDRMRALVLSAYPVPRTIDVLSAPAERMPAVSKVRRAQPVG